MILLEILPRASIDRDLSITSRDDLAWDIVLVEVLSEISLEMLERSRLRLCSRQHMQDLSRDDLVRDVTVKSVVKLGFRWQRDLAETLLETISLSRYLAWDNISLETISLNIVYFMNSFLVQTWYWGSFLSIVARISTGSIISIIV